MNNRYDSAPVQGGADGLDGERQVALDSITSAFALGKISLEEYELRAEKIQKASASGAIAEQTRDLPREEMPRSAPDGRPRPVSARRPYPSPAPASDLLVEQRDGSPEFSLCVMGDRKLTGDWLNSDQAVSFTLMGSTTLDLRNTALPPGRLKIDAIAIMGEVRILVPRGLPVKMSAVPFMGEANVHSSVEQRIDRRSPWVDVSGIALMGSIIVKTA